MLILFVFFRCLRRALWCFFVGLFCAHADLLLLPFMRSIVDFLVGKSTPHPLWFRCSIVALFYLLGLTYYTGRYFSLLSQKGFESKVLKDDHWKNSIMPQIQKEVEAGELVFPSANESWIMPPQEYRTRMYMAGFYWKDPELRQGQPKLHDSIFKI